MKHIIEEGPIFKKSSFSELEKSRLSNEKLLKLKGGQSIIEEGPIM